MRYAVGFLTGCCSDDLFTSISFNKKALSTINIYTIVIRLKSQVLRKEDSMLVAVRQTCKQFFAHAQSPWNTGQTRSPPELPGWSKVTTTYFLYVTNLDCFDLGTSLKKLCFKPRQ